MIWHLKYNMQFIKQKLTIHFVYLVVKESIISNYWGKSRMLVKARKT